MCKKCGFTNVVNQNSTEQIIETSGFDKNERWEILETSVTMCRKCGEPLFSREVEDKPHQK